MSRNLPPYTSKTVNSSVPSMSLFREASSDPARVARTVSRFLCVGVTQTEDFYGDDSEPYSIFPFPEP